MPSAKVFFGFSTEKETEKSVGEKPKVEVMVNEGLTLKDEDVAAGKRRTTRKEGKRDRSEGRREEKRAGSKNRSDQKKTRKVRGEGLTKQKRDGSVRSENREAAKELRKEILAEKRLLKSLVCQAKQLKLKEKRQKTEKNVHFEKKDSAEKEAMLKKRQEKKLLRAAEKTAFPKTPSVKNLRRKRFPETSVKVTVDC